MAVRTRTAGRTPEANRRADIEAFLVSKNVSFTYREAMPTKHFDVELSLRNQARLGQPLDQSVVTRYTEALQDGDIFPPVLAARTPGRGEQLEILDGNHRLAAYIAAGKPIDAYVCESANPQTLVLITYLANTKHGLPSSVEDRLHHALFLVDSGVTAAVAAAQLQVPKSELARAVAKQKALRRADDAGVPRPKWEAIPQTARARLAMANTDEGFRAAVQLVLDAGLTTTEIDRLIADMNDSRNAARQVAVVKAARLQYGERIEETQNSGARNRKGHRGGASPRARLAISLGQFAALPGPEVFKREKIPPSVGADLAGRIDAAIDTLTAIRKTLS